MIQLGKVSKTINDKTILQDISFEIQAGECVALIGPNGAGKTTLMSCMLGNYVVTNGSVLINEQAPKTATNKKIIAMLMQENVIPASLKVSELIAFFQGIYPNGLNRVEVRELLQFTDKQENQLAEKLSGGQKRLLAFVLCLIGKPEILFLDEPTAGMDTSTRQRFWQIIQTLKSHEVTIIYSSHYIEEVEHSADRILVLHQGRLIRDTTPYTMRSEETSKQLTLPISYLDIVGRLNHISEMVISKDYIQFETTQIQEIWTQLQASGCPISDVEIQNKTLLNTLFDATQEGQL